MYHGVTATPLQFFNWCQLEVRKFEEQMKFLAQEHEVLPLSEIIERLEQRRPLPDHTAAITFDDGFRNVATTAFPILERFHLPSTVFLVTGLIGNNQPPWTDRLYQAIATTEVGSIQANNHLWPLTASVEQSAAHRGVSAWLKTLDNAKKERHIEELFDQLKTRGEVKPDSPLATMAWNEIERLADTKLVAFGSHTHSHPILSRCSVETQRAELATSRDVLRTCRSGIDVLAYPNGTSADFTSTTKTIASELGYRCALATTPGLCQPNDDLFELRRVNIGADTAMDQFETEMLGL
jgi:peptidoglycan/xylan/chitin deacetylase (PgdA/CDA1 family)